MHGTLHAKPWLGAANQQIQPVASTAS